jgi:hypothetical protein
MALLNRSSVRKDHNCHQAGNDHLAALACPAGVQPHLYVCGDRP